MYVSNTFTIYEYMYIYFFISFLPLSQDFLYTYPCCATRSQPLCFSILTDFLLHQHFPIQSELGKWNYIYLQFEATLNVNCLKERRKFKKGPSLHTKVGNIFSSDLCAYFNKLLFSTASHSTQSPNPRLQSNWMEILYIYLLTFFLCKYLFIGKKSNGRRQINKQNLHNSIKFHI